MQRGMCVQLLCSAVILMLTSHLQHTDAVSVMSIDLGSEFMKVAIVKPGVPMEIALNKESRRKTPVLVAMRNGERLIGDPAVSVAVKFPKLAYHYLLDLLGKKLDNPQVALFKERFPYYTLEDDKERGTVVFKHDDNVSYTPEELIAMVLQKAKDIATDFADSVTKSEQQFGTEQPVTDAVITVPAYFNQAERRSLMRAGEIAGIKVLQIMNHNAAVALNYGVFRSKSFNATAQYYMFYDMGANSATASIVAYQTVKTKNEITGLLDSYPQLTVKGVGFDRTLGGMVFQMRLRNHLANVFNSQKKTKKDVREDPRAMAKLFKEAGRVKRVLSANVAHFAQVEGLIDEIDFRAKVTREEFDEMCKDLFERVGQPIANALEQSQITLGEISEVILMGGGTRIPKVQEQILKSIKREEVSKSINTDEAAALGAVYQAAHLSKGFRVKKFNVRDANLYPIQITFHRASEVNQVEFDRTKPDENGVETTRTVKRTLFGRLNAYPQKKVMTFNKHLKDFGFKVSYGDLTFLSQEDMKVFGSSELSQVSLSGVETAHGKHSADKEAKGVKAHFKMDESGILTLDKVESVFEQPPPPEEKKEEEESTLSKLGSTISNLFGGGKEEKKEETKEDAKKEDDKKEDKTDKKAEKASEKTTEQKSETDSKKESKKEQKKEEKSETKDGKKEEKKEEKKENKEKKSEEKKGEKDDKNKTDDKSDTKKEEKKEEKKAPPKPTIHKEPITVATSIVDLAEPSDASLKASKKKIEDMRARDIERVKREKARNELESFVYNSKDKMYEEDYELCSTEQERIDIREKLTTVSDWMEMDADDSTTRPEFEGKLSVLTKAMSDLTDRVKEKQERPKFLEALNSVVNYTDHFRGNMKNFTGDDLPFTKIEYDTLDKLINETKKWNETLTAEQAKTLLTEKPKILIADIATKINALDREVKYLVNKAKLYRPKPKPAEKANTTTSDKDAKTTSGKDGKTTSGKDEKTDSKSDNKTDEEKTKSDKKEETKTDETAKKEESTTTEGSQDKKFEPPPTPEEDSKSKKDKAKDKKEEPEETLQLDGATEGEATTTDDKKDDKESKDNKSKTHKADEL